MKQTFLLSLTLFAASLNTLVFAQSSAEPELKLTSFPKCAFQQVLTKAHISYPELLNAYRANSTGAMAKTTGVVYDIPVVFHIVYKSATFNIPDSVIANQLTILNQAYRKQHADTGNVRSYFKPLSGDAEIQFHLAAVDPLGNPSTGITRTLSTRNYFGTSTGDLDSLERIKRTSEGGIDPWPTNRYLNIWIGNLSDAQGQLNVLGYGIPPLNPLPNNWPAGSEVELAGLVDGVVIQTHAAGSNSSLNAALQGIYSKGRAMVHEVGHYLGLQHVFGGNDGVTATCAAIIDDGIGDTPDQALYSFDANSGFACPPDTKNSCGAGNPGDLPDMWEDYMDYTRDACQTMFTNGQIAVMRLVLANQRGILGSPQSVNNESVFHSVSVFPNPSGNNLSIAWTGNIDKLTIYNFMGEKVLTLNGTAANAKTYDISKLTPGNYLLILDENNKQAAARFTVVR